MVKQEPDGKSCKKLIVLGFSSARPVTKELKKYLNVTIRFNLGERSHRRKYCEIRSKALIH